MNTTYYITHGKTKIIDTVCCSDWWNGTDVQRQRIDQVTAKAVRVSDKFDRFDAAKYMEKILAALPEVYGEQFNKDMEAAFNDCIFAQLYSRYLSIHAYMVEYTVLLATNGNTFRTIWDDRPVKHLDRATLYKADGRIVEYSGEKGYYRNEDDFDTLNIGCEKCPQHDMYSVSGGGVM